MTRLSQAIRNTTCALLACCASSLAFTASAAENTLENVQSSKVLRIGVAPGDPWYFKDPISGKWDGVGFRVGAKVAQHLGARVEPVETTYANAPAALQAKQIDVFFVLDATEERKKALDFPAQPLLWYKQGVLARENLKADNWDDLNKPEVRIGVALGTATDRDLTKRLPNAKIERFANTDETIAAFVARRVDAFAFYHPALAIAQSRLKTGNLVVPEPVIELPTSAGVRKEENQAWLNHINSEIQRLNNEGEVQKIFSDYMAAKGLDPAKVPKVVKDN